jgi:hypothetical protein
VVSVGSSAGKLRIFEPDHGDVPWDAQTYLLEDAHGADRHEVGCGEDRVQVGAAGQDRAHRGRAAGLGEGVIADERFIDGQTGRLQRAPVPGQPSQADAQFLRTGDGGHATSDPHITGGLPAGRGGDPRDSGAVDPGDHDGSRPH